MRKAAFLLGLLVTAMCLGSWLGGCAPKQKEQNEMEADELYTKSLALIQLYTDSITNARDSATIDRLNKDLEHKLTLLNFDYRADTYLDISEGQNDTLTRCTLRFAELRDSLLYALAHHHPADTIPADTVAIAPVGGN